jgi:hypothetical protein
VHCFGSAFVLGGSSLLIVYYRSSGSIGAAAGPRHGSDLTGGTSFTSRATGAKTSTSKKLGYSRKHLRRMIAVPYKVFINRLPVCYVRLLLGDALPSGVSLWRLSNR